MKLFSGCRAYGTKKGSQMVGLGRKKWKTEIDYESRQKRSAIKEGLRLTGQLATVAISSHTFT
jgi:hypothetical protein